jgi:hypothetical protein
MDGDARQPVVEGWSWPGLGLAQLWVIRSPATSNASTVTMTPSCWTARPGWPLTVRSRIVGLGARPAVPASSARPARRLTVAGRCGHVLRWRDAVAAA